MPRKTNDFLTVRSEGGLLPPDLLRRIVDAHGKVPGTRPEDYNLLPGDRLNETITHSWNKLRRHWADFRNAARSLPEGEAGTALTNEKWNLPLLRELGFGIIPTSPSPVMGERTWPINRFFGSTAIHLIGCGLNLDRRATGARGAGSNPHGLVQEFLNRSSDHLWAILSNGLRLRILRDNQALSRQSFLEFDVEAIFSGEVYSDFVLLWLMAHATRFTMQSEDRAESCWLEQWTKAAAKDGTRALEKLQSGVEKALQILGEAFVSHPKNTALREALRSGALPLAELHEQLLRVVYRLLFLFVAEDRTLDGVSLLHPAPHREGEAPAEPNARRAHREGEAPAEPHARHRPREGEAPAEPHARHRPREGEAPAEPHARHGSAGASPSQASPSQASTTTDPAIARERYVKYYSTKRLRELSATIKGSRHGDLWEQLNLVFMALSGKPEYEPVRRSLALPALGSLLWNSDSTPHLNAPTALVPQPSPLIPPPTPTPTPLAPHSSPLVPSPCSLSNADFLEAIRHLAFTGHGKVARAVDYRNLGAEELGGVYTSLLELTPQISADGSRFTFAEFAGNARKTSGSYYTPDSLVQCLLDSALDPVVEDRLEWARELGSEERASRGRELYASQFVSGSDRLAEGHGPGGGVLSGDKVVSAGRDLRSDVADSQGSRVHSGEHRRGLGTRDDRRVRSLFEDRAGQHKGTGNAPAAESASGPAGQRDSSAGNAVGRGGVKDDHFPDWFFAAQAAVGPDSLVPYSLLAEKALLSLRICDPSVGSGHFLVGAAHRLARHLSRVRAWGQGESEPSPLLYQQALRDVISRCLYGVDINPMAVELCRVNLWLEALEPGKPLSFLDHHIQVGNSLLGTTPALLAAGIPDDAFTPIEGDVKARVTALKKQNKKEREEYKKGQGYLFDVPIKLGNLAAELSRIDRAPDDTTADVQDKERRYRELVKGTEYQYGRLLADTWCAAFVWKKDDSDLGKLCPTERDFRKVESHAAAGLLPHVRKEVERLRDQYQLFHWHLAFPDVFRVQAENGTNDPTSLSPYSLTPSSSGWSGGFDVMLGNPPWERIKLQEKEWFAERRPEIANSRNAAERRRRIDELRTSEPSLFAAFLNDRRAAEGESHVIRNSSNIIAENGERRGLFPFCGRGDINTYAIFAELNRRLLAAKGRTGCIVPSGIASDDTTKFFFQDVVETRSLVSLFDFENRDAIFPGVHRSYKFCLLTAGSGQQPACNAATFVFFAHQTDHLNDPQRRFSLSPTDISLLNPNTQTCPIFRSRSDAELTKRMYRNAITISQVAPRIAFFPKIDMTDEVESFVSLDELQQLLPKTFPFEFDDEQLLQLYESKLVWHYDHRFGTFGGCSVAEIDGGNCRNPEPLEKSNSAALTVPRYFVPKSLVDDRYDRTTKGLTYLLTVRRLTNATNERTAVFCLTPYAGCGNSMFVLNLAAINQTSWLLACGNSIAFDYITRNKLGGTNFLQFIIEQLAVIDPHTYEQRSPWTGPQASSMTHQQFLLPRVLELTYTAWDLEPFAKDCGYAGPPFRWDDERRSLLRAELDAAFFHLYLPTDESGDWRPARKSDGCPHDESPEDLARLKASFPKPRDAVSYIMDTFPIVRRKDEEKYNGDYRTKRVILEIYDAMQQAIQTGQPYQTRLTPPPGPPTDNNGNFLPPEQWDPQNWPSHIHPRRGDV